MERRAASPGEGPTLSPGSGETERGRGRRLGILASAGRAPASAVSASRPGDGGGRGPAPSPNAPGLSPPPGAHWPAPSSVRSARGEVVVRRLPPTPGLAPSRRRCLARRADRAGRARDAGRAKAGGGRGARAPGGDGQLRLSASAVPACAHAHAAAQGPPASGRRRPQGRGDPGPARAPGRTRSPAQGGAGRGLAPARPLRGVCSGPTCSPKPRDQDPPGAGKGHSDIPVPPRPVHALQTPEPSPLGDCRPPPFSSAISTSCTIHGRRAGQGSAGPTSLAPFLRDSLTSLPPKCLGRPIPAAVRGWGRPGYLAPLPEPEGRTRGWEGAAAVETRSGP